MSSPLDRFQPDSATHRWYEDVGKLADEETANFTMVCLSDATWYLVEKKGGATQERRFTGRKIDGRETKRDTADRDCG